MWREESPRQRGRLCTCNPYRQAENIENSHQWTGAYNVTIYYHLFLYIVSIIQPYKWVWYKTNFLTFPTWSSYWGWNTNKTPTFYLNTVSRLKIYHTIAAVFDRNQSAMYTIAIYGRLYMAEWCQRSTLLKWKWPPFFVSIQKNCWWITMFSCINVANNSVIIFTLFVK